MPNLRWLITELARRLWVRASIFAVAGIFTAVIGIALAPLIPAGWSGRIGADSVDNVLQILASSMLAVTTFSLATMVSAYATASSATTPRVAELLILETPRLMAFAIISSGMPVPPCRTRGMLLVALWMRSRASKSRPFQFAG